MKKYWISYYRDFSNTYNLFWTDSPAMEECLPANAERISRKDAIRHCVMEKQRQADGPAFSGFASTTISPAYPEEVCHDVENDRHYTLVGYIYERVG